MTTKLHTWTQREDGFLQVDGKVPVLSAAQARVFDGQVWRWRELASRHAQSSGVPIHWVLGFIYAESGGNPNATSPAGAVGLMQLHSAGARAGHTLQQCYDPELNVRLGTQYLAKLVGPKSPTLPHVASRYNAGQKQNGSPHPANNAWGMRHDQGFIDRVVAASNTALQRLKAQTVQTGEEGAGSGLGPLTGHPPGPVAGGVDPAELWARFDRIEGALGEAANLIADIRAAQAATERRSHRILAALSAANTQE